MRRCFYNEREYMFTVEQDRRNPPCRPPVPKPPPCPDIGFDCTYKTGRCKVRFCTDPFCDTLEINCKKPPDNICCDNRSHCCHKRRPPPILPFGDDRFFR